MDRAELEERRKKILEELEKAKAAILMRQGALALLDDLLKVPAPKAESK